MWCRYLDRDYLLYNRFKGALRVHVDKFIFVSRLVGTCSYTFIAAQMVLH